MVHFLSFSVDKMGTVDFGFIKCTHLDHSFDGVVVFLAPLTQGIVNNTSSALRLHPHFPG